MIQIFEIGTEKNRNFKNKNMIICHILLISLLIIYASWYLEYHTIHSNASDVQGKIDNAITRLIRDTGASEVKQKYFKKQQVFLENAIIIQNSEKLK